MLHCRRGAAAEDSSAEPLNWTFIYDILICRKVCLQKTFHRNFKKTMCVNCSLTTKSASAYQDWQEDHWGLAAVARRFPLRSAGSRFKFLSHNNKEILLGAMK